MSAKVWIIGFLLMCGIACALPSCSSTPTPDPDNGVSNASYREALTQIDTNISQVVSKLLILRQMDALLQAGGSEARVVRSVEWWDAEIMEAKQAQKLAKATLKGAGK